MSTAAASIETAPRTPRFPSVPRHVAVIMDGNGRWARGRGLPRLKGHEAGAEAAAACVNACDELGIDYLTLYAFSTENWKRPREEVEGLMRLLERFLEERAAEIERRHIRFRTIGRIDKLPGPTCEALRRMTSQTAANTGGTLTFALNYSGRAEITDAVRSLAADVAAGKLRPEDIDEAAISGRLNTAGMPDPDLLIRTSGELRISNFMLWQLSYTEIHISAKLWPDFREPDFFEAIESFNQRKRRYGAV